MDNFWYIKCLKNVVKNVSVSRPSSVKSLQVTQMSYIWFYNNDFTLNYWQVTITEVDQYETISDTGMLMNYDNTIMEIL